MRTISPVHILTVTPALRHCTTASRTPGQRASSMPMMPISVRSWARHEYGISSTESTSAGGPLCGITIAQRYRAKHLVCIEDDHALDILLLQFGNLIAAVSILLCHLSIESRVGSRPAVELMAIAALNSSRGTTSCYPDVSLVNTNHEYGCILALSYLGCDTSTYHWHQSE